MSWKVRRWRESKRTTAEYAAEHGLHAGTLAAWGSKIDKVISLMLGLERENERLAWRLLRAVRYRFGRSTEKLSKEDLTQLFLALGGTEPRPRPTPRATLRFRRRWRRPRRPTTV